MKTQSDTIHIHCVYRASDIISPPFKARKLRDIKLVLAKGTGTLKFACFRLKQRVLTSTCTLQTLKRSEAFCDPCTEPSLAHVTVVEALSVAGETRSGC